MTSTRPRIAALTPAACTVLYIAGKAQFALEGRLGIHGGPAVTAAEQAQYADAAQISAAQWANAAAGLLILTIVLLPILPGTRRWRPLALAIPLVVLGTALTAFGIFMLIVSLQGNRGGHLFGIFCVFWGLSVLPLAATLRVSQRSRRQRACPTMTAEGAIR